MEQTDRDRLAAAATLVQVIDCGSLSAAAARSGRTPSAVSKQIARLEAALDVRLLERTTRRVRPTDAGLLLYGRTRPLLEAFEEAQAEAADHAREVRGRVRLSASPAYGRARLAPVLARLAAEHPQLELEVLLTGRRLDFIEDGIDLAVREGRMEDASWIARPLGRSRIVLVAAPAYLAEHGRPRRLADLARHELLLIPRAAAGARILESAEATLAELLPRSRVRVDDLFTLAELAVAGAGIAAIPDYVADAVGSGDRLEAVLPRVALGDLPLHVVYPARRHLSRRVEVVLDALTAAARAH
jgi:DNA-binding transcriptional LysR family regulator